LAGSFLDGSIGSSVQSEPMVKEQPGPACRVVSSQFRHVTAHDMENDVVCLILRGDNGAQRSRAFADLTESAEEFAAQIIDRVRFYYI